MSYGRRDNRLDCKVYVGELGYGAAKQELEDIFSRYGPLRSVWVARNPPGFAFVEFEDERDVDDACRELDGTKMNGRRVRVEPSSGRTRWGPGGPPTRRGGGRYRDTYRRPSGYRPRMSRADYRSPGRSPRRRSRSPYDDRRDRSPYDDRRRSYDDDGDRRQKSKYEDDDRKQKSKYDDDYDDDRKRSSKYDDDGDDRKRSSKYDDDDEGSRKKAKYENGDVDDKKKKSKHEDEDDSKEKSSKDESRKRRKSSHDDREESTSPERKWKFPTQGMTVLSGTEAPPRFRSARSSRGLETSI